MTMSRTDAIVPAMTRNSPATSQRAALIAGPVVLSRTSCTTRSIVSAAWAGQSVGVDVGRRQAARTGGLAAVRAARWSWVGPWAGSLERAHRRQSGRCVDAARQLARPRSARQQRCGAVRSVAAQARRTTGVAGDASPSATLAASRRSSLGRRRRRAVGRRQPAPVGGRGAVLGDERLAAVGAGDARRRARRGRRRSPRSPGAERPSAARGGGGRRSRPSALSSAGLGAAARSAAPVDVEGRLRRRRSTRRADRGAGTSRARSATAAAAPRTRTAVGDGPRRAARPRGASTGAPAPPGSRRVVEGGQGGGDGRLAATGVGGGRPRATAARTCRSSSTRAWSGGVGGDPRGLLGGGGAVEVGGGELVEGGVGHGRGPGSLRSVGRRASAGLVPGLEQPARAGRARGRSASGRCRAGCRGSRAISA